MKWRGGNIRTTEYGTDERNRIIGGGSTLLTKYYESKSELTRKEQYELTTNNPATVYTWDGDGASIMPTMAIPVYRDEATYGENSRDGDVVYPERVQVKMSLTWKIENQTDFNWVGANPEPETLTILVAKKKSVGTATVGTLELKNLIHGTNSGYPTPGDGELPLVKDNVVYEGLVWGVMRPDEKRMWAYAEVTRPSYIVTEPAITHEIPAIQTTPQWQQQEHRTVLDIDLAINGVWSFKDAAGGQYPDKDRLDIFIWKNIPLMKGVRRFQPDILTVETVTTFTEEPRKLSGMPKEIYTRPEPRLPKNENEERMSQEDWLDPESTPKKARHYGEYTWKEENYGSGAEPEDKKQRYTGRYKGNSRGFKRATAYAKERFYKRLKY